MKQNLKFEIFGVAPSWAMASQHRAPLVLHGVEDPICFALCSSLRREPSVQFLWNTQLHCHPQRPFWNSFIFSFNPQRVVSILSWAPGQRQGTTLVPSGAPDPNVKRKPVSKTETCQKLVNFIMLVSSQSQKEAARFDLAQALCKTPLPENFDGHNTNTSLALKSVRSRVARQVGPTLQDARLVFSHICTRGKIEKARRTTFLRQSPGAIARLHPPNNLARLEYHFWGSLMLQWFPSFVLFFCVLHVATHFKNGKGSKSGGHESPPHDARHLWLTIAFCFGSVWPRWRNWQPGSA